MHYGPDYVSCQRHEADLMRGHKLVASGQLGKLPPSEAAIPLAPGDSLVITRDLAPGRAAIMDEDEETVLEPARIGCTLPEVFDAIAVVTACSWTTASSRAW